MSSPPLVERFYGAVTDSSDPGDPTSEGIPAEAAAHVPRNFALNAFNGACTKLAEQLASPGAVLALLIGVVGAPVGLVGLLEPTRRGGSLVPQMAVAGRIRARRIRKRFWTAAGLTQALALLAMLAAAAALQGLAAGLVIVAALAVFSMASGVGSVAFGDVVGKTIPEPRRGQLLAFRATAGGALTLVAGLALLSLSRSDDLGTFLALLGAAAALWFVAALLFAAIREPESEPSAERGMLAEARAGMSALTTYRGLRTFTAARGLLLAVELSVPFLVVLGRDQLDAADVLAIVVLSIGLANLLSNYAWGRIADRISTRLVMIAAGLVGALAIAAALAVAALAAPGTSVVALAPVFFAATAAEAGIRVGRKAWVVNAAPERDRPLWVAATNTLAGVVTLAFAALGGLAELTSVTVVVATLLALALAGILAAWLMPEDDRVIPSDP